MNNLNLRSFNRRVRLVRAWKGLAMGACFGSLAAAAWAGLDWANVAYAEWSGLGLVVAAGAAIGAIVGGFLRISPKSLADSIDRRADLEDRLTTSIERGQSHSGFDDALHADAESHLQGLKPAKLYPVRVGRWHAAALAAAALASGIFLLGNTAVMLNSQQKKDREAMKEAGQTVQRVLKPVVEDMKTETPSAQEQRLAEELRKLAREMEKSRLTKEEAMQKSNELEKQAEELTRDKASSTEASLAKAESAMEKLQKDELEKAGLHMDPSDAKMTQAQRDSKSAELQKQMDNLEKQISQLQQQMSQPGKSQNQLQQLSKELQKLLEQQKALNQRLQSLKLSKEVQEMLKRMMENPLYKQLQELADKLAQASKDAQQNPGQPPQLTDEQLKEMEKQLEELAKQLKDDKAMEEYLKALMEAMKNMKKAGHCNGLCLGLGVGLTGLSGMPTHGYNPNSGPGGPSRDTYFANVDKVHHSEKPDPSKGTTTLTAIKGDRDETKPGETYVEIKGPTMVGNRSSVAYTRDVLSARKRAEQAIDRQKIPKEHEKRVKAYFDSLTKG